MARKSAAELELEKAEAAYVKLHPLASQGNDVAPVTRGELRIILEDLLGQIGKAVVKPQPAPAPTSKPEPELNLDGAEEIKQLGRESMEQFAQMNGIDISGASGLDDEGLAQFIAASMNANSNG